MSPLKIDILQRLTTGHDHANRESNMLMLSAVERLIKLPRHDVTASFQLRYIRDKKKPAEMIVASVTRDRRRIKFHKEAFNADE